MTTWPHGAAATGRTSVFIGLVTHRSTRFADAAGPDGLMARLAKRLRDHEIVVRTLISDDDAFEPGTTQLDTDAVRAAIDVELATEERWRMHIDPTMSRGFRRIGLGAFMQARRSYRRLRFAPPWQNRSKATDAGPRMVRRLVNIELSHLNVMRQAVEAGATWILVIEDDASGDAVAIADALTAFMHRHEGTAQPAYVNVSRSFTDERLRTSDLLVDVEAWDERVRLLAAKRPITNTVCAILYRGAFLRRLLAEMDSIPLEPVQPIDWKLNDALMRLYDGGELGTGDCWVAVPAPIDQGSMHGTSSSM